MRVRRVRPERVGSADVGAVLARDRIVGAERWSKGRRLSAADVARLREQPLADVPGEPLLTLLVLGPDDLHEDDAALRLAAAVAGDNLALGTPQESRVNLTATAAGVAHVDVVALERLNRLDLVEVFTVFDGQVVEPGDRVASVKFAPHVVRRALVERAERLARHRPVVRVAAFVPQRVAIVVKASARRLAPARFEEIVRQKLAALAATCTGLHVVADEVEAIADVLARLTEGPQAVDLILTAGAASSDPADAVFVALRRLGGRIVRHGVPAHPGSMLWLGRLRSATILGLPTCGAYSRATAVDLLLPRLLSGEPPDRRLVAKLGHGGLLSREMRFRFPRYARELESPEG